MENKFFFELQEVVEKSSYLEIIGKPMKRNDNRASKYFDLCEYIDGGKMGVYNLGLYVDMKQPKDKRMVHLEVYKCRTTYKNGKIMFIKDANNQSIYSCNIPYLLWDNVRATVIASIYALCDRLTNNICVATA